MALPSTITLNVGSPAADVVYASKTALDGNAASYAAPSPQGDLTGRPTLRVSSETTKAGIERSLTGFQEPIYSSSKEAYSGYISSSYTFNRSLTVTRAVALRHVELMAKFLAVPANREAIVDAAF